MSHVIWSSGLVAEAVPDVLREAAVMVAAGTGRRAGLIRRPGKASPGPLFEPPKGGAPKKA